MKIRYFFTVMALALCFCLKAEVLTSADGAFSYVLDAEGRASIVLGDEYYVGDVVVPATIDGHEVVAIGDAAFNGCHGLTSVSLPSTITRIGKYAFNVCDSLAAITIPENVTEIGDWAFHGCARIVDVVLPEPLTTLGDEAFFGCVALKTVTMGKNLTKIGERVFQRCTQMRTFTVDAENPAYKDVDGILMNKAGTVLVDFARKNTSYRNYTVPETVTEIAPFAFYGCDAMKTVELPEGLFTIGDWAWGNVSVMAEFTLPASVKQIGRNAFFGMKALKRFRCLTEEPLALNPYTTPFGMFTDLSTRTLYVPSTEAVARYQAAPVWQEFGTIMFEGSGVTEVAVGSVRVSTQGLAISITGAEGAQVTLYDINGAVLADGVMTTVQAPAAGFYVLKVGNKSVKLSLSE